ncbi:MAG: helix-turn-helix transcriptional regulator [Oscillospiraceae bacterium]|nr:helix-turn-helix transcriptional regulator [Oscillospiraceae bacterium]
MQERFREKYRVLGLKIAYYRKKCGYTQEQMAELIDKSWSFVAQVEANNGKKIKGISLETLFTISEVLDVPVEKFFAED